MAVTVRVEGDFLIYRWETEVIHPSDFPWTSEVCSQIPAIRI